MGLVRAFLLRCAELGSRRFWGARRPLSEAADQGQPSSLRNKPRTLNRASRPMNRETGPSGPSFLAHPSKEEVMRRIILALSGAALALTVAPADAKPKTYVCTKWSNGVCVSTHRVKGTAPYDVG